MWFEQITNWIIENINKPLPIVGVSLVAILFFAWKIFASSSFGKKQLKEYRIKFEQTASSFIELKNDFDAKKAEYESKIAELESFYEEKLAQSTAYDNRLEKLLIDICEYLPNKNIKVLIEQFKTENHETILEDIKKEVESTFESRIKALEDKQHEEKVDSSTTEE